MDKVKGMFDRMNQDGYLKIKTWSAPVGKVGLESITEFWVYERDFKMMHELMEIYSDDQTVVIIYPDRKAIALLDQDSVLKHPGSDWNWSGIEKYQGTVSCESGKLTVSYPEAKWQETKSKGFEMFYDEKEGRVKEYLATFLQGEKWYNDYTKYLAHAPLQKRLYPGGVLKLFFNGDQLNNQYQNYHLTDKRTKTSK